MEYFKLIGTLKAYAENLGWAFLFGENFYQNYEASQNEYHNGQLVLAADFTAAPRFVNGKIDQVTYSGVLMLGIKFDDDGTPMIPDDEETPEDETQYFNDGTPSNLDETAIQKYEKRLEDLLVLLGYHIGKIACANELEISQCQMRLDMNKFDTNIDFIAATITFIQ